MDTNFRERKTLALQEELRSRIAEHRIREFPLFQGAKEDFFEELSHRVYPLAYMPKQTVFSRGESGDALFLLLEGRVSIQRKGDKRPVFELAGGDIFGEMSLLLNAPRSATVRTEDYCKLYELEKRHLHELGKKFPWFTEKLRALAESRLRKNADDLASFEARVGINRPDLPRVDIWALVEMQGEDLVYMPSLLQDIVVGYSWQGEILWHWGKESGKELFQPYRLAVLPDSLLVTDTGNGRVLEIDKETREIHKRWRGMQNPRSAVLTQEKFLLVAEEGKGRLITLTSDSEVNWEFANAEEIALPYYAELTPQGTVLFADAGLHRVCEISLQGQILWTWGEKGESGNGTHNLKQPSFAHRLADGSTLIADTGNHRLVWLRPDEEPQLIKGNLSDPLISPMHVEILPNGEWLVYSVSPEKVVRLSCREENIWSASLSPGSGQSTLIPSTAPISAEDHWILDLDRLQELEQKPVQVAELTVEQELQTDKPEISETLQAELEARATRWKDLELESEGAETGEHRWKGLDFLDEVASEVTAEIEKNNLFSETAIPLSEEANQAFAFLDEEQFNLNQTVMQLPTTSPEKPTETSNNPFGFLDEILTTANEAEIEAETENPPEFSIHLAK